MNFRKFLVSPATARCCGLEMVPESTAVVLREPAIRVNLDGYRCQVCQRVGVTEENITSNTNRVLLVARVVKPSSDVFRLMKQEQKEKRGSE